MKKSFSVRIPASSGNLGPGFDVLGLALALYNEVRVDVLHGVTGSLEIHVNGEGKGEISESKQNLVYQTMAAVFKRAKKSLPSLKLTFKNRIPLARGLGSSSAAILEGLLAGNELVGQKFNRNEILAMASKLEGHPDNVASALLGGVQASKMVGEEVRTASWPIPRVTFVAAIPEFQLSTKRARKVVPKVLTRSRAISNLGSVSLMPAAFSRHPQLLRDVLDDSWHEPYRARLIPGFHKVRRAAIKSGAYGVTLSGAGPTLLAWSPKGRAKRVGKAMEKALRSCGVRCKILTLKPDRKGAVVR